GWRHPGRPSTAPESCCPPAAARRPCVTHPSPPQRDPVCIVCKIVAGELPATIVDQADRAVAFKDISPATRGHALVVPRRHWHSLLEIAPDDLRATVLAAQRLAARVVERLGADGVNLLNSC